ncbi:MAG: hypothetical protein HYZ53_02710 [Planctomycetes bacterium]|nr:hypothetical protein [Planctomycetota bacterium]
MITPRSGPLRWYGPFAIAALLLLAAGGCLRLIDREFAEERSAISGVNPFEQPPPDQYMVEYLSSILLGGFKAIAVDYLWVHAIQLQQQKRFEEIPLLLGAIVRLQPKQPEIWIHNSWNMSYNIAAQYDDPAEKWKWVEGGIKLLKDGLKTNPRNPDIEYWIGYTYWHRIPQQDELVRLCEEKEGRDPFELAVEWLAKAQADRITKKLVGDVYEGLTSDAFHRQIYFFVQKGWFDKALGAADQGIEHAQKIIARGSFDPEFWKHRIEWMNLVKPVIGLERELWEAADVANGEKNPAWDRVYDLTWRICSAYRRIKLPGERYSPKPMEVRQFNLLMRVLDRVYALVEQEQPDMAEAGRLLKRILDICPSELDRADAFLDYWRMVKEALTEIENFLADERKARESGAAGQKDAERAVWTELLEKYENLVALYDVIDHPVTQAKMNRFRKALGREMRQGAGGPAGGSFGEDAGGS